MVGGTVAENPQRFEVTVINFTVTLLGLEVGSKKSWWIQDGRS